MKPKIVHRASKILGDGAASALCFKLPRAINLKVASWTARDSAVTCEACKKIIGDLEMQAAWERLS